jgi:hypothetical protein
VEVDVDVEELGVWASAVGELVVGVGLGVFGFGTLPGGAPAKITNPPWSHSSSQSALTVTSAAINGDRSAVYRIGAVDVSRDGGFRHRSVFGGAESVKEPIQLGTGCGWLSRVKEEDEGGIAVCVELGLRLG